MTLQLRHDGGTWTAEANLEFEGHPHATRIGRIAELVVSSTAISFVDLDGPNDSRITYRGVYTGQTLAGIAEVNVPARRLFATGDWSLTRVP